jgi:hypothetical protein
MRVRFQLRRGMHERYAAGLITPHGMLNLRGGSKPTPDPSGPAMLNLLIPVPLFPAPNERRQLAARHAGSVFTRTRMLPQNVETLREMHSSEFRDTVSSVLIYSPF